MSSHSQTPRRLSRCYARHCLRWNAAYIDAAATSIDAIWHAPLGTPLPFDLEDFESTRTTSSPMATSSSSQLKGTCGAAAAEGGLPLRVFIQETLRRSRTSCSTLQVALLYCIRCAFAVRERRTALASSSSSMSCKTFSQLSGSQSQTPDASHAAPFPSLVGAPSMSDTSSLCARRMFLASVMLASKFLQDRNYSARAWSRISGLAPRELARIERVLLGLVGYNLAVAPKAWESWVSKLQNATRAMGVARSATCAVMGFSTTGPGPGANQKAEMYAAHPMRRTSLSRTASDSEALAPAYDTALPEPALPGQKRDLAMQAIEARDSPLQSQSQSLPPRQQHLSITQPPLPFPRSRMCMPGGALASASHDHDIFALDRRHSSSSSSLSVSMSATPTPTPGVTPTPSCAQALGSKPAGIVTVSDPDSALASLQAQEQVQVQVQVQSGSDLAKTEVRETVAAAKWAGSMLAL